MKPSPAWIWLIAIAISATVSCAHDPLTSSGPNNVSSMDALVDLTDPLANPPALEETAQGHDADVRIALAVARAKLKTLNRYRGWQAAHEHYDAHIGVVANHHVVIMFAPPLVTDSDITIEVDAATKTIVDVRQGEA